jgi:hypothetical protein
MTQHSGQIQVKDIDHLGIVAGMIDQMGWVDAVNEIVGVHSLEQVSTGQLLKGMILNGHLKGYASLTLPCTLPTT